MEQMIYVCGVIGTFSVALAALVKWVVLPIEKISKSLGKLDKMDDNQKILMKSTASMMEHLVTGNHIEKLKEDYEKLIEHCIDN